MINLLIAGYHGFGNCGDEAILKAMTKNIRNMAKDVSITALSYRPEFTKTEYNIDSVDRFNFIGVLSAIRKSDIILSGGGTLLQDGTSTRSLLYYLAIIKFGKLFGKKVMLYANGIGPVNGSFNRKLVKRIVNTVDIITLREKLSEADLRNIGVNKPDITVTADPAFGLDSVSDEEALKLLKKEGLTLKKKPWVGVSVRAWNKAYDGEDYVLKLAKACDEIIKTGKELVFIPMEFPKDVEFSKKVASLMKQKPHILKNRYNPSQILGIIGQMDVMLSMRLHALIFAAVKNVPMLGIIYDPKVEYYIKELDMIEAGDVRSERLDPKKIASLTCKVWENIDLYKQRLKLRADIMAGKARENDILLEKQIACIRAYKKGKSK